MALPQHSSRLSTWSTVVSVLVGAACCIPAQAQQRLERGPWSVTVEGYANLTTAPLDTFAPGDTAAAGWQLDSALRLLGLYTSATGPDVGARAVVEHSTGTDQLELVEASLLVLGRGGRLEFGERQGLPDVLLGYAPNNFTFTGAEYGPASGPSLDPGGGLTLAFLAPALAGRLRDLTSLGFAATLADDRSAKLLYVTPKRGGWLGGLSFAADAADERYTRLLQAGLTYDRYWGPNVLHVGGSYSHAESSARAEGDLDSLNVGATLVLDYDLLLGISAGYDDHAGLPEGVPNAGKGAAYGAVASINYNVGAWTFGGFVQRSSRAADPTRGPSERFTAFEAGASYRWSTRLRLFGAWYAFDYDADDENSRDGGMLLLGMRATL